MSRAEWYNLRPVEPVDLTTVWRDGQVLRRDWRGQTTVRATLPLDEPALPLEPLDAEVVW